MLLHDNGTHYTDLSALLQHLGHSGEGLRVPTDADVEDIDFNQAAIIIEFSDMTDGRGYSLAHRLRRKNFAGQIIASGGLIADQWAELQRVGFNAVEIDADALAVWARVNKLISVRYLPEQHAANPDVGPWRVSAQAS